MKKRIALYPFFLVCLFALSCKKNNDPIDKKDPEPKQEIITSPETDYTSFEVFQIPLESSNLNREEITGSLNSQPVKLLIENGVANAVIPDLPDGKYMLEFTYGKTVYKSDVTIKNILNIRSAESYATQYQTSIEQTIQYLDTLVSRSGSTEEKEKLRQTSIGYASALEEFDAAFKKLNQAEKGEFAKFMAANSPLIDELREASRMLRSSANQLAAISIKRRTLLSTSAFTQSSITDLEAEQAEAIKNWLRSTAVLAKNIGRLAIILYSGPVVAGALPVIGTVAVGIAAGYLIIEVAENLKLNLEYLDTLIDKVFIPYDKINLPELSGVSGSVFKNMENKIADASANYRNILSSDKSESSGGVIASFIESYSSFAQSANQLITKIPARYRLNLKLREFSSSQKSSTKPVHNKYVFVENVNNAKVDLKVLKQADGRLSISASTTAETDQEFTYDVVYRNSDFSTRDIKTTMQGKVIAEIDSTEIYKKAVIGHWVNTWINETSNTVDEYDVMPDGVSQWIRTTTNTGGYDIPRNDPYAQYSWKIYKLNNRYYFHMPANIRNISFSGYIENYPNMRIVTHPNQVDNSVITIMEKK